MWTSVIEYYLSNGTDNDYMNMTDHWGGCYKGLDDPRCQGTPDSEGVDKKRGWYGVGR